MKILVTGAAGFIGSAVCERLLRRGDTVIGADSLNDYYDVQLKEDRVALLKPQGAFTFAQTDLADRESTNALFLRHRPERVIHLAAQPGVRYSLTNPHAYLDSNLVAFLNVLEECRRYQVGHLVYASSSSVYGAHRKLPYSVTENVDHPISLYAATKKANELIAHSYSHLYRLPTTGLRFFTVYGPWGRPDMAHATFARNISTGQPINVHNFGNHRRDFTFIDDAAECVLRVCDRPAAPDTTWRPDDPVPDTSNAPYRIYNVGTHQPVLLSEVIRELEDALGRKAIQNPLPLQPGDALETFADVESFYRDFGFRPQTSIHEGTKRFAQWFVSYYEGRSRLKSASA